MNLFTFFITLFGLLGSFVVQAAPLNERDIFDPPILDPHAGTVWTSGQQATATWDTSNPPKQITDRFSSLLILRKGGIEHPDEVLAKDFDILDGNVSFIVPEVTTGNDWSVVLFGDSGNWSEDFTINNPNDQ